MDVNNADTAKWKAKGDMDVRQRESEDCGVLDDRIQTQGYSVRN